MKGLTSEHIVTFKRSEDPHPFCFHADLSHPHFSPSTFLLKNCSTPRKFVGIDLGTKTKIYTHHHSKLLDVHLRRYWLDSECFMTLSCQDYYSKIPLINFGFKSPVGIPLSIPLPPSFSPSLPFFLTPLSLSLLPSLFLLPLSSPSLPSLLVQLSLPHSLSLYLFLCTSIPQPFVFYNHNHHKKRNHMLG